MKYSLWCFLFGHKWWSIKREYRPHYKKLTELGIATTAVRVYDFDDFLVPSNWCFRCGLTKEEAGITKLKEKGV